MSAVDEHAEAHRLKDELGYGARRIGRVLGISRYAAEQLLLQPVAGVADEVAEVADDPAGQALPGGRPADRAGVFVAFRPGLGRDLADLMRTGCTAADAAAYAVAVLADAYRTALEQGRLAPGDPLDVAAITFRPPAAAMATAVAAGG